MAQQKAINANAYNNNGGTTLTSATVAAIACGSKDVNKVPAETATSGTDQVDSGGTWAQIGQILTKTPGVTTSLAGQAKTGIGPGNPIQAHSIHAVVSRRTVHITSWNYATGVATKGNNTVDAFGDDHASTPTRAIPGELVYTTGAPLPTMDDYKAITG